MYLKVIVFVEGVNDTVFIGEVLKRIKQLEIDNVDISDMFSKVRNIMYEEKDIALITEYANIGLSRALINQIKLCNHLVKVKDAFRYNRFLVLTLLDANRAQDNKLNKINETISKNIARSNIYELTLTNKRRYTISFTLTNKRLNVSVTILYAFIECSLECEIVRKIYKRYDIFCNTNACHELIDKLDKNTRVSKIKELVTILEDQHSEEWYRNLKHVLTTTMR